MEIPTAVASETPNANARKRRKRRRFKASIQGESVPQGESVLQEKSIRKRKRKSTVSNYSPPEPKISSETSQFLQKKAENGITVRPTKAQKPKSSNFLDKMRARLSGGHFRMLNEKLYTCRGNEAFELFKNDPSLFNVYHAGYQEQMSHWPQQPVDIIINWLKERSISLVVADFGCGDARLAKSVKNKVFSIDLVSSDPSVIACDMAHTPFAESSVDVAVFCLSLMGTDFPDYLKEAYRILKPRGWLLVAEVKSRFDPGNGGADPNKFVKALSFLGFKSVSKDFSNKMFVLFYFRKESFHLCQWKMQKGRTLKEKQIDWPRLKPCIYKRR